MLWETAHPYLDETLQATPPTLAQAMVCHSFFDGESGGVRPQDGTLGVRQNVRLALWALSSGEVQRGKDSETHVFVR